MLLLLFCVSDIVYRALARSSLKQIKRHARSFPDARLAQERFVRYANSGSPTLAEMGGAFVDLDQNGCRLLAQTRSSLQRTGCRQWRVNRTVGGRGPNRRT